MPSTAAKYREFWSWFVTNADRLLPDKLAHSTIAELTARITDLHEDITWEIGPGTNAPNQMVISPNLSPVLWETTQAIVSFAPLLTEWEFYSARPPKKWDMKLRMRSPNGQETAVDGSNWKYVLLEYEDGEREIVLLAESLPDVSEEARDQLADIFILSIVGEDFLLRFQPSWSLELLADSAFASKARPIETLYIATVQAASGTPQRAQ